MRRIALLAAAIFLINAALNAPVLMPGEMPFRGSIEGGYASMARFISEHPDPHGWNPLQYCGLPTQFMYLPALPYATAALVWITRTSPENVWHILTGLLACLGPATLFLFVYYFTRAARWSVAAALAYTFFSPCYGLFQIIEKDRGIVQLPWRIQVLAKYGEGPHNAGLMLLPLALIALFAAGSGRHYRQVLAAAVLLATVVLTNWVAAMALAICCGLMLLSVAGTGKWAAFSFRRAFAAAGLAYLLGCFWLTPSFIATIAGNWPADSFGYHFRQMQALLLSGLVLTVLIVRTLFLRYPHQYYLCFVTLCALVFGWLATGYYTFLNDTIPESRRYALEFEFFLLAALCEWFRLAIRNPDNVVKFCAWGPAAVMLVSGAGQAWTYASQGWSKWKPVPKEKTLEYRVSSWLAAHPGPGRVLASGGTRYRLNSWFDVPQVGGGFESGLRNRIAVNLAYQIRTGRDSAPGRVLADALLELKALGVGYIAVHKLQSEEYYRDFTNPEEFEGVLPAVYRDGPDAVYSMPVRSLAHLVRPEELPGSWVDDKARALERYAGAIEDGSRPGLNMVWTSTNRVAVEGAVPAGMVVSLQMNHDPGWGARQDGRPLAVERDRIGFVVLRPAPGTSTLIELYYAGTAEQRIFGWLAALAWVAALASVKYWKHESVAVDR